MIAKQLYQNSCFTCTYKILRKKYPSRNQTPLHKKFIAFKLVLINVFGFDCHNLVFVLQIKFSCNWSNVWLILLVIETSFFIFKYVANIMMYVFLNISLWWSKYKSTESKIKIIRCICFSTNIILFIISLFFSIT